MDMLYRAYSCPMDLMNRYINQGRFGDFVQEFLTLEYERKKEEAEKDNDWHLWVAYVHSETDESFDDWKARVCKPVSTTMSGTTKGANRDMDLNEDGINAILGKLFHRE